MNSPLHEPAPSPLAPVPAWRDVDATLAQIPLYALLPVYTLLWFAGYWVSNSYWFLPAGVRIAGLLRLPSRQWGWLYGAELLAIGAVEWMHGGEGYRTLSGLLSGAMAPWLVYALGIWVWRRHNQSISLPDSPQMAARLFSLILACCGFVALLLIGMQLSEGYLAPAGVPARLFSYMVGDFVGILCVAPLLLQVGDPQAVWRDRLVWRELAVTLLPLALVLLLFARMQPDAVPFVALLVMVPPVRLAFRRGWRGAALAIAAASATVYYSSSGVLDADSAALLQMFLAILGAVSLMLGAWSALEKRLWREVESSNAELAKANQVLSRQAEELRTLGARLVTAQEEERQRIRADLRGEMSQQITQLGGQIAMLARRVEQPEQLAMVDTLRSHVQAIRDATEECVDRLQPQALTRLGLAGALNAGGLRQALETAGINFQLRLTGDEAGLAVDDRLAVFRLIQHLVGAVLRFPECAALSVSLDLPESEGAAAPVAANSSESAPFAADQAAWVELKCRLVSRRPLDVAALQSEREMQALRDRLLALGGRLAIEPDGETTLSLSMQFALDSDRAARLKN